MLGRGRWEKILGLKLVQVTMEDIWLICKRLFTAHSRYKSYANKRRQDLEYEVGYHVFLKMFPTKCAMRFRKNKVDPRFIGTFIIMKRVGALAYELTLPLDLSHVHRVFYVLMLRKYMCDHLHVLEYEPLQVRKDLSYKEQPLRILDRKKTSVIFQSCSINQSIMVQPCGRGSYFRRRVWDEGKLLTPIPKLRYIEIQMTEFILRGENVALRICLRNL